MIKFKRNHANSSPITSLAYNAQHQILEVVFCQGGIYEYFQVKEDDYQNLTQASSIGQYFNEKIRGHFPFRKAKN